MTKHVVPATELVAVARGKLAELVALPVETSPGRP